MSYVFLNTATACDIVRDGDDVAYVVEDTLFSERTQRLAFERG